MLHFMKTGLSRRWRACRGTRLGFRFREMGVTFAGYAGYGGYDVWASGMANILPTGEGSVDRSVLAVRLVNDWVCRRLDMSPCPFSGISGVKRHTSLLDVRKFFPVSA